VNSLLKKSLLVTLAAAGTPAVWADAPKVAQDKPVPARSVFVMPANPQEGRDPFFPESTRPYEEAVTTSPVADLSAFSLKGISVERGHAMAIINNHTFAVGDEGDVLTAGKRVHVRVIEIRSGAVVIDVNGARRELTLGAKQK
jgi:hypothetical protein